MISAGARKPIVPKTERRDRMSKRVSEEHYPEGIVIGDAVQILRELKNCGEHYDLIIADPPYNIGKDFGNGTDARPMEEYIPWTDGWVRDCFDLLTDNGLLYVYGLPEIIARIAVRYPIEEQRWLVWHYTNKTVPSSTFWQRSHETILCLWRPGCERPRLELDQIREPYTPSFMKNAGKPRKDTPSRYGRVGKMTTYNAHKNGALPRDVLKVPALAGGAGRSERWFVCKTCSGTLYPPQDLTFHRNHRILKHPTQKPMKLTERLIKSRINGTGGKLLVPFAGSGSECVVARDLGIEYLGIELNSEYASFARQWLARANEEQLCIA